MKCLDTNAEAMDYRQIFEKTFDSFDAVFFINLSENKIFELKSSSKFPLLHSSDDAQDTIQKFRDNVYPEDLKIFEAFNLFSGQALFSEIRCKDSNEKFRWCCCQLIPVNEHSYYAMYLDLTDCRNEGIQLKNEYLKKQSAYDLSTQLLVQKYNAVVNHADIVLIEYNTKTRMLSITSNLHDKLLSIPDFNGTYDEFIVSDYVYENDKPRINSVLDKLKFVGCTSLGISVKNSDGDYSRCEADFYGVYGQDGAVASIVGSLKPVEPSYGYAGNAREDKYRDYATGLLSGKAFCDSLKSVIEKNLDKKYAVIMFDIERFKSVNEVYGVQAGDSVIRYVALKINEVFNYEGCLTARFMSDFFGVLTPYEDEADIGHVIKTLNSKISLYKHISLKYAYGVYKISDKSIPPRLICDYANMAKNSVKGNHINNIAFYTEGMKDRIIEEIFIENDMEKALEEEQFLMYLQPKYNIENGNIVGAEALARWNHPNKGFIKPAKFIPLFEKNGFIISLDQYIWEQACKTIKKWCDMGIMPVPVSVNVSRINLKNPQLVSILNSLVEKYQIDKRFLELEITETVYYDDQQALVEVLEKLKRSGYTLLMDDFGSGFSSLSMLKNTPFDVIKIDKNFLNETMITDRGKKIIQHTIFLSNDIGMNTVAEGVETKEQADYLLACGCNVAQGYYYSKPVPVSVFEDILDIK